MIIIAFILIVISILIFLSGYFLDTEELKRTALRIAYLSLLISSTLIVASLKEDKEMINTSVTNDSIYIINNMKYIIIKGNVINVTKDSLECKFYKDEENF